jgi:hypothetical protein
MSRVTPFVKIRSREVDVIIEADSSATMKKPDVTSVTDNKTKAAHDDPHLVLPPSVTSDLPGVIDFH